MPFSTFPQLSTTKRKCSVSPARHLSAGDGGAARPGTREARHAAHQLGVLRRLSRVAAVRGDAGLTGREPAL